MKKNHHLPATDSQKSETSSFTWFEDVLFEDVLFEDILFESNDFSDLHIESYFLSVDSFSPPGQSNESARNSPGLPDDSNP